MALMTRIRRHAPALAASLLILVGIVATVATKGGAAVTGSVKASIDMKDLRSVGGAATTAVIDQAISVAFTNGTGANQVTDCVTSVRSVTTGNDDMQLDALTGPFGSVALAAWKVLLVDMRAATANVTVSRPTTAGAGLFDADLDAMTLVPGGVLLVVNPSATGIAIANGDTDVIRFVAASGTQAVTVTVCGEV